RVVSFGRPRGDAARRLREDPGSLQGRDHLGRGEHLVARSRGRALSPSGGAGGGGGGDARRQVGRNALCLYRNKTRFEGDGEGNHRVLPSAPGEIQGAARGGVRRAAEDLDRQDPEIPAARKGEVRQRDRHLKETPVSAQPQDLEPVLRREDRDGICTLTLNRPKQMNLLTSEMLGALQDAFESLQNDSKARVVVLAAAGKGFCAGHDLKEIRSLGEQRKIAELFAQCSRMMMTISWLPQPVIAKVQGAAAAAGAQLVAQCDLAIASESAKFVTSGVSWGFFCSTPGVAIGRNLQRKHAMEWGLVNRVVAPDALDAEVQKMAELLAAKPAATLAAGKRAFYQQMDLQLGRAYELASEVISSSFAHPEGKEGMAAFIEKRKPDWKA